MLSTDAECDDVIRRLFTIRLVMGQRRDSVIEEDRVEEIPRLQLRLVVAERARYLNLSVFSFSSM